MPFADAIAVNADRTWPDAQSAGPSVAAPALPSNQSVLRGAGRIRPAPLRPSQAVLQREPDPAAPASSSQPADPQNAPAPAAPAAASSGARQEILDALHKGDAVGFTNKLKGVDKATRASLEADTAFLGEIQNTFTPLIFWVARTYLHFGDARPEYVTNLEMAVREPNMNRIKDLVRAYKELRSEADVPGVREMLSGALAGRPAGQAEVLQVFDDQETDRKDRETEAVKSVRYGVEGRGGEKSDDLHGHSTTAAYTVARTASELRVIVRIRLVSPDTADVYPLEVGKRNQWIQGIEERWNGKFLADNKTTQLKVVFVPIFVDGGEQHVVRVITTRPPGFVPNANEWPLDVTGTIVAHEFGHLLGLPDEYGLPGSVAEIPKSEGLSDKEAKQSSVEGVEGTPKPQQSGGYTEPGMMGGKFGEPKDVKARHVLPAVDWYNANLKPQGEADYDVAPQK